jgi:hypothetical protein
MTVVGPPDIIFLGIAKSVPAVTQRPNPKKNSVWDPMPVLTITSPYAHSRVDSDTFTMGIGQPYARFDLQPMSEFTLSPSQGLWIWPLD